MTCKAKRSVNYAVDTSSEEEEGDDVLDPTTKERQGRASKRRKTCSESDDEDVYIGEVKVEEESVEEGSIPIKNHFRS